MTQSLIDIKKKALDKWAPILDTLGLTGSRASWMAEYAKSHSEFNEQSASSSPFESAIFPTAIRVAAKTIGQDLVTVQPMSAPGGTSNEEMERIKNEVKSINRENKIDSITEDKEYKEMDIKDHPDYNGPTGNLFYFDFQYGSTSSGETDSPIKKLK